MSENLFGIVIDTVFLSSGFAALRRATGISVAEKVAPYVNKYPSTQTAAKYFFQSGEWTVDKVILLLNKNGPKPPTGGVHPPSAPPAPPANPM